MRRLATACLGGIVLAACATGGGGPAPPGTSPADAMPSPSSPRAVVASVAPRASASPRATPRRVAAVSPAASPIATPTPAPAVSYVADYCVARDWLTPYHAFDDHAITVLDPTYAVPADYVPPDLVGVSAAGFVSERGDELVRAVAVDDLAALRRAATGAGLTLLVESGYRSPAEQQQTFDEWVARIGYEAALRRVARAGHSEHQLGTAVDFTSPGWTGRFGDWAVESVEGAWVAQHSWEFGFVMSYPAGADAVTCYGYEPWHYRWIGRELAADWVASGVTLHEFLVLKGSSAGS